MSVAMTLSLCTFGAWGADSTADTGAGLRNAVAAASSGDTITLSENVDLGSSALALPGGVTIDMNGKTINGTIHVTGGTIKGPAGDGTTPDIVGPTATDGAGYRTDDAVIQIAASGGAISAITIADGDVTLAHNYGTTNNMNLVLGAGASFTIPAGIVFDAWSPLTVNGTLTINGTLLLSGNSALANNGTVVAGTAAALNQAVSAGGNVRLGADIAADVVIPSGKTVALDLNGKALTGASAYTETDPNAQWPYLAEQSTYTAVVNRGKLTITDGSPAKTGRISAAGENASALYNDEGATAELNGGTFTTNKASGAVAASQQDNWYVIRNHGTMTMNDGVKVTTGGDYQLTGNTMITNGYEQFENQGAEAHLANGKNAVMTINGGVYEGGVFVVKNGDWDGEMTINGGTFAIRNTTAGKASNWGAVVSNSNNCTMTITGGVFNGAAEGKDPVVKAKTKSAADEGSGLTITGGTFSGPSDVLQTLNKASGASPDAIINVQSGNFTGTINQNTEATGAGASRSYAIGISGFDIFGGNFTADPTIYLADGYITANSTVSGYKYTATAKPPVDVNVAAAVAAPEVKEAEASAAIPAAAVDAVNEAAKEVAVDKSNSESMAALTAAAADVVQDKVTETVAKQALTDVTALPANKETTVTAEDVTVLAQTYFAIEPKAAETNADGAVTSVTLEIKPMCQLVATTNDVAEEASYNENAVATSGDEQNAVKLGAPTPIEVVQPVTFTIGLPVSLVVADGKSSTGYAPLTIRHVKENGDIYYYTATVTASELQSALSFYGTFTVTHGFSTFTLAAQDTHTMSVAYDAAGGTASVTSKDYAVTDVGNALATAAKSGYTFDGWKFTYGQGGAITGATETYKTLTDALWTAVTAGKDATVSVKATAQYSAAAASDSGTAAKYVITAKAGSNGTVTPAGDTSVASGSSKTYTIAPNTGYAVEDVTVDGESVGAMTTYTFRNIAASHLIQATFYPASWVNPFKDVAEKNWYFRAVRYVNANGLFDGISSDTFAPDEAMTRGMFVTVLWRLENKPVVNYAMNFTDVKEDQWYAEAVRWAASEKIAKGYGDGTFRPSAPVQRQELAALLYRYAQYKGYDVSVGEDTNILSYDDAFTISEYAMPAIQWACGAGLMDGYGGNIHPRDSATRAQVAKVMMAFRENVTK
jgi:hypothetical protein